MATATGAPAGQLVMVARYCYLRKEAFMGRQGVQRA